MKPASRYLWIAGLALTAASAVWAAKAMKDPLYGDPEHPNISGMWNPEYAYFGPPIGDGAKPPGPPPGAAPAAGARPPGAPPPAMAYRPPMPELTPPYAKKYAEWRKKFETGEQDPDSVTRCLAFGIAR